MIKVGIRELITGRHAYAPSRGVSLGFAESIRGKPGQIGDCHSVVHRHEFPAIYDYDDCRACRDVALSIRDKDIHPVAEKLRFPPFQWQRA